MRVQGTFFCFARRGELNVFGFAASCAYALSLLLCFVVAPTCGVLLFINLV